MYVCTYTLTESPRIGENVVIALILRVLGSGSFRRGDAPVLYQGNDGLLDCRFRELNLFVCGIQLMNVLVSFHDYRPVNVLEDTSARNR